MTDLTQAIAELRRVAVSKTEHLLAPRDEPFATILNAVASGELFPLADHKLAVALMVEKAAQSGYVACAETRHVSLGNKVRDTICALIPDDALEVQALRDDLRLQFDGLLADATKLWGSRCDAVTRRAEAAEAELAATQAKLARVVEASQALVSEHYSEIRDHEADRDKMPVRIGHVRSLRAAIEGAKP